MTLQNKNDEMPLSRSGQSGVSARLTHAAPSETASDHAEVLRAFRGGCGFGDSRVGRALTAAIAALEALTPKPEPPAHYFTPDPTKRFCVICGDNGLGSVWGIHRFQIQPGDPDFKPNSEAK